MTKDPFMSFFDNLSKGAIGFDDTFRKLNSFNEQLAKLPTYPPYNIVKTGENTYVIEVAVAGFGKQDIELILEDNVLTIKGQIKSDQNSEYLFKGIADRAFTREFTLADTVQVQGADLINGLLKVWLESIIPEHKKPKKIEIREDEDALPAPKKKIA